MGLKSFSTNLLQVMYVFSNMIIVINNEKTSKINNNENHKLKVKKWQVLFECNITYIFCTEIAIYSINYQTCVSPCSRAINSRVKIVQPHVIRIAGQDAYDTAKLSSCCNQMWKLVMYCNEKYPSNDHF